jgi:hypothetical protein
VLAITLAARAGHADGYEAIGGAAKAALVAEIAIPDFRYEIAGDAHRWTLSFPIVVASEKLVHGDNWGLRINPFLEPQYQRSTDAYRGALGARLLLYPSKEDFTWALITEGGLLAGTDGSGGFVGGGFALGVPDIGVTFGLVGRLVQTSEERRSDFALDLQIPIGSDEY